ncbi:hypothetical protein Kpol_413p3 [Vanderwaltozyma polyspora DSM 70294]|uniref:BRO1 domain-containing protein n=1 Tax=Vanderwaltozyma polyspora (strain ATCC 22028 / DSM 70294 / BCRC 21397 / CBS 2163 / NBRC 10782 / NRRL Y-8283 / UCD 57-17) TaxID=436907 RepID=A7TRG8_VANPO|nr:uncharacterized protein Kpol_413p3 [Vanderwaltozyma polyspora DSM 70294]EDO15128.1 hypothetical protein Kpol_413p3 [Vanderwaltozyma polyspora DSM 70294]
MSEILTVPFKRTLKIDFASALRKVIDSNSYQASSFFEEDILKLANLRDSVIDPGVSEPGLQLLKQYYKHLVEFSEKIPSDQIEFTWFQTLCQKSYKSCQYDIKFEQLNILYNIGALYALLAIQYNDQSKEGLKKACSYLQISAGYYSYVLKNLDKTKEPVIDRSTGEALVAITLAEAQELFWFRALIDKHKDSLISKLAQQTCDLYKEASQHSSKSELIRGDWSQFLIDKSDYFKAVAYYRNALQLETQKRHGEMVRSLEVALDVITDCKLEKAAEFRERIETLLKESRRDNDFIYLEEVPTNIDIINGGTALVKIVDIEDDLNSIQVNTLFKDLLPTFVLDAASAYNERQEEYVINNINKPIEALNKLLNSQIPRDKIPDTIKLVNEDEINICKESFNTFNKYNELIRERLNKIEQMLNDESRNDKDLRLIFGTLRWRLPESDSVNKTFYDKLNKLRCYSQDGKNIDNDNLATYNLIDINLLTTPMDKIPRGEMRGSDIGKHRLLKDIGNEIRRRELIIDQTANFSSKHRILPLIIELYKKNGQTTFESEFKEHLEKFSKYLDEITKMKSINGNIIKELSDYEAQNQEVKKEDNHRLTPLQIYIEDWQASYKIYEQVKESIRDGSAFYEDLIKNVDKLFEDTVKFIDDRNENKELLKAELNHS